MCKKVKATRKIHIIKKKRNWPTLCGLYGFEEPAYCISMLQENSKLHKQFISDCEDICKNCLKIYNKLKKNK